MQRTRNKRFKKDYSQKDILAYLKGVSKILRRAPTFRDLNKFPGPSPRTIVRRFGHWTNALKTAGLRPHTHQLLPGERQIIRMSWRKKTDKQIAKTLGVTDTVIKYYRMNYKLWKNRKGTAKSTYRNKAFKLYGKKCEVCGINICEWHHIIPRSTDPNYWCILCPICHEIITRKIVSINSRNELQTKLKPYIRKLYQNMTLD